MTLDPEEVRRLELPYVPHPILGHDQPRASRETGTPPAR